MVIGVDLGVTQAKAVWDSGSCIFPSFVAQPQAGELEGLERTDGIVIEYAGQTFYVGDKAKIDADNARMHFTGNKFEGEGIVKYLACVGYSIAMSKKVIASVGRVVVGAPIEDYNRLRKVLPDLVKQATSFKYNGRVVTLKEPKVSVMPEGAGAYYDLILDAFGTVTDTDLAAGKVLVVDIGGRTTDVVTMQDGKYVPTGSFTIPIGVVKAQNHLRRMIGERYTMTVKPADMEGVFRYGMLKVNGEETDISDMRAVAEHMIAQELTAWLRQDIEAFHTYDRLFLAGGGAMVYGDAMKALEPRFVVAGNAEFANASGFYKYGQLLEAQAAKTAGGK